MTQSTINYPITVCGILIDETFEDKELLKQLLSINGLTQNN